LKYILKVIDPTLVGKRTVEPREQSSLIPTFSNTETAAVPSCSSYQPNEQLLTATSMTHSTQQDQRRSLPFTDAAVDVSIASMFSTFAFRQHSDVITTRN